VYFLMIVTSRDQLLYFGDMKGQFKNPSLYNQGVIDLLRKVELLCFQFF